MHAACSADVHGRRQVHHLTSSRLACQQLFDPLLCLPFVRLSRRKEVFKEASGKRHRAAPGKLRVSGISTSSSYILDQTRKLHALLKLTKSTLLRSLGAISPDASCLNWESRMALVLRPNKERGQSHLASDRRLAP